MESSDAYAMTQAPPRGGELVARSPTPLVDRPGEAEPELFTSTVALHRMRTSWTPCDSCLHALAVWMVRAYDRAAPMQGAASAIWLVCDDCVPPAELCTPWSPT